MKNTKKKGFTLVELVIVIAVIAILAGVLIGTFAGVISRANQSKAVQEWKAAVDEAYVEYVAEYHVVPATVKVEEKTIVFGGDYTTTTGDALVNGYVSLNGNVYVELDTTNKVYLVWNKDTDNSTYAVATNYNGYTEADAKDIVEAYVKAQLAEVPNATNFEITGGTAETNFGKITFNTTNNATSASNVILGKFSGKVWKVSFTVSSNVLSAPVVSENQ